MFSDDADQHRLLADPSRRRILELLAVPEGPRDAHALAAVTGLHPTTVRSHLVQLLRAGLVTADRRHRDTPGRPRTEYTVVPEEHEPQGDPVYRELAGALVEGLAAAESGPDAAAAAGDAWGRRLVSPARDGEPPADGRSALISLMGELGFSPEDGEDGDIVLGSCPLAKMAAEHPEIVCRLHQGLMQGVLDETGADRVVTALVPFVAAGKCVARLDPRQAVRTTGTGREV